MGHQNQSSEPWMGARKGCAAGDKGGYARISPATPNVTTTGSETVPECSSHIVHRLLNNSIGTLSKPYEGASSQTIRMTCSGPLCCID